MVNVPRLPADILLSPELQELRHILNLASTPPDREFIRPAILQRVKSKRQSASVRRDSP
jgi:hypothetical protein